MNTASSMLLGIGAVIAVFVVGMVADFYDPIFIGRCIRFRLDVRESYYELGRHSHIPNYHPDPYDVMNYLIARKCVSPWARKWGRSRMIDLINEVYDEQGWIRTVNPLLEKYLGEDERRNHGQ